MFIIFFVSVLLSKSKNEKFSFDDDKTKENKKNKLNYLSSSDFHFRKLEPQASPLAYIINTIYLKFIIYPV